MSSRSRKALIAIFVLILFGGFGAYVRSHQAEIDRPADFDRIPLETDKYFGVERRFEEYTYDVLKADTTTLRMYRDKTGEVFWLFVAYFSSQKYGSQIHSPITCVPGGGYRILTIEPYVIDLHNGSNINVRRLLIASQRRKEVMLYWFETRSGVISGEYGLKFDLMKNSIFLLPTDAAICRVTIPLSLEADFEKASLRAAEFVRDIYPAIQAALPFYDS